MCSNQTAVAAEQSAHVRNPNGYLHPLPCVNNVSSYNTTGNTTYVMFGATQEDVNGIGYILLFSALVSMLAMLYCVALRAGMIEASVRREQIAAIRHSSSSYDAMTLTERREYIDRVLKVKTFGANDSRSTSSEHSDAPPQKAAVTVAISKPFEDSGDTATDIEDLSMDGCLDDVSLNDDDNPKTLPCCAICLEPFRCGDQVSYSHDPLCSHEYHTTCIVEWLLKHMNCPYCRRGYIPIPPSVKKASMVVAPSQQHVASGWDYVANAESSSTSTILPSPTAEPIDIEMGEGATSSAEALPRNSIPEDDERISI